MEEMLESHAVGEHVQQAHSNWNIMKGFGGQGVSSGVLYIL